MTNRQLARFWRKVHIPTTDGCWLWQGSTVVDGYGTFMADYSRQFVHRISWQLANGPIPDGLLVCHTCDVRHCVRPDHLFLGTHKDNTNDAITKGRFGPRQHQNQTHCVHGHAYTPENTVHWRGAKGLQRLCRTCYPKRVSESV